MTDYEEPAAKISKIEVDPKEHDEEMDEGQEEWLSEGILTDDDYNPAADHDKSANTSQGDTTPSLPDDDTLGQLDAKEQAKTETIEKTLDNFEKSQPTKIPDELGAFLVRKTDSKVIEEKKDSEIDESTKQSDDDGNDTDELLRMLGEDGQKSTKEVKKPEQRRSHDSHSSDDDDDDDEYIFEGAKVARLKVAKNVVLKKYPSKAVPENVSDSDMSSDEATIKKIFVTRKATNYASKSTAKPINVKPASVKPTGVRPTGVRPTGVRPTGVKLTGVRPTGVKPTGVRPTGVKPPGVNAITNVNKIVNNKIVTIKSSAPEKPPIKTTPSSKPKIEILLTRTSTPKPTKTPQNQPKKPTELPKVKEIAKESPKLKGSTKSRSEPEEIIDEEEFLEEEEEFDLDEDFESEPEKEGKQRIMRPEQMDEEVPTDGDSLSEDDSYYDEFPSSESDQEEWFTLDIRSERAGDYIPLLGSKAHQLLVAEKQRVTARLSSLRQNISTLNESSQHQAEMLRRATMQLAELDAALKA